MSPYAVLGVEENSNAEVVKAAYRKLAMQYHPDRNQGDEKATAKFMEVQTAYDQITTPQPQRPQFNFTSVMETAIEVTVEEAFHGTNRSMSLHSPFGGPIEVNVAIPAMTLHGTRLKVGGLPNQFNALDLYIVVLIGERGNFSAMGTKIIRRVSVDFVTAIIGGEMSVETLDGVRYFEVPAGSQTGSVVKLSGLGFVVHGTRDDFVVILDIALPTQITDEQRQLLEQYRALTK